MLIIIYSNLDNYQLIITITDRIHFGLRILLNIKFRTFHICIRIHINYIRVIVVICGLFLRWRHDFFFNIIFFSKILLLVFLTFFIVFIIIIYIIIFIIFIFFINFIILINLIIFKRRSNELKNIIKSIF